jgi:hypothetical protein
MGLGNIETLPDIAPQSESGVLRQDQGEGLPPPVGPEWRNGTLQDCGV